MGGLMDKAESRWCVSRLSVDKAIASVRQFQSGAGVVLFMEVNNHVPLIFSQVAFT